MIVETQKWTNPRNGEVREYVNNWADLIGLECERYNTGNIRSALLGDEHVSNARAGELLRAKVWRDSNGVIHVNNLSNRAADVISGESIARIVSEAFENSNMGTK